MRQASTADQLTPAGRAPRERASDETAGRHWLFEPKTAVWMALAAAVLVGGGRKLSAWWQARRPFHALARPTSRQTRSKLSRSMGGPVFTSRSHFQLIPVGIGATGRRARAGASLAARSACRGGREGRCSAWVLRDLERPPALPSWAWLRDSDRRHLRSPVSREGGRRVGPENLEWSHRVIGAGRAALEEFSPWAPGPGRVAFTIFPGDFETNGPHRLVLETRIRTAGLTDSWELEPPHEPFNFEFDPLLRLDAIMTIRDSRVTRSSCEPSGSSPMNPATTRPRRISRSARNGPWQSPLACRLAAASLRPRPRDLGRDRGNRGPV